MFLRTEDFQSASFAGHYIEMSFAENKTRELWQGFMPQRKSLSALDPNLYSIEIYPEGFFKSFNPHKKFQKWAAVKIDPGSHYDPFKILVIPSGLYAVFIHKGPASAAGKTYQYIYNEWIKTSGFAIDTRPHFAVMGPGYSNDSADSEEEILIPVRDPA